MVNLSTDLGARHGNDRCWSFCRICLYVSNRCMQTDAHMMFYIHFDSPVCSHACQVMSWSSYVCILIIWSSYSCQEITWFLSDMPSYHVIFSGMPVYHLILLVQSYHVIFLRMPSCLLIYAFNIIVWSSHLCQVIIWFSQACQVIIWSPYACQVINWSCNACQGIVWSYWPSHSGQVVTYSFSGMPSYYLIFLSSPSIHLSLPRQIMMSFPQAKLSCDHLMHEKLSCDLLQHAKLLLGLVHVMSSPYFTYAMLSPDLSMHTIWDGWKYMYVSKSVFGFYLAVSQENHGNHGLESLHPLHYWQTNKHHTFTSLHLLDLHSC